MSQTDSTGHTRTGGRSGTARDPLLEVGPRLALCALLQGARWIDFATARDLVGAADSVISKHSRTLEDAGYLEVRKGAVGRRARTWFLLTDTGRNALTSHLAWLTSLHNAVEPTPAPDTRSPDHPLDSGQSRGVIDDADRPRSRRRRGGRG